MQYVCQVYPDFTGDPDTRVLKARTLVEAEREAKFLLGDAPHLRRVELWCEGVLLRRGRPDSWGVERPSRE
jgi:hypothetical protein